MSTSTTAVDDFFARLYEDSELEKEYWDVLGTAIREAVVALAGRHGFPFTAEELRQAWSASSSQLSEQQLDAVAGGLGGHSLRTIEASSQLVNLMGQAGLFTLVRGGPWPPSTDR